MKVVFATPMRASTPCAEYFESALMTEALLRMNGVSVVWDRLEGDPYVMKARNSLAGIFLRDRTDADVLFFIDDDVGWEPLSVLKFLWSDKDVLCGVYPKKSDELEFPVEILIKDGRVVENAGFFEAALAATGFMAIKRHVLEACAADSGMYPKDNKTRAGVETVLDWDIFRVGWVPEDPGSRLGRWWGEDYFFSIMCRHLGFHVWIDPDIEFTHRGTKKWKASFGPTLREWIKENDLQEPKLSVTFHGDASFDAFTTAVMAAFEKAQNTTVTESGLPETVLAIEGMSGKKYQCFINALVSSLFDARYLEVGSWKGSTAAAAAYNNSAAITCIDNWSEFGENRETLLRNVNKQITLIEEDFRQIDFSHLPSHNVYFYDACHEEQDHIDGILLALPALDDEFILIVDDWNWTQVRKGTFTALKSLDVVFSIEIRTQVDDAPAPTSLSETAWYNGYYIAVVKKPCDNLSLAAE